MIPDAEFYAEFWSRIGYAKSAGVGLGAARFQHAPGRQPRWTRGLHDYVEPLRSASA
jgi:hypothetical protein